jgi:hypothetical protein
MQDLQQYKKLVTNSGVKGWWRLQKFDLQCFIYGVRLRYSPLFLIFN